MKITKYEHSCLVLETAGKRLVIDPGIYSKSFNDLSNIAGVVVTHIHGDHFDLERLKSIAAQNPESQFFGPRQVADEAGAVNMQAVSAGETKTISEFSLEFFGGKHEFYEGFENIAVLVNGVFFHPGDSYTQPGRTVEVLALPASAPWLRVLDAVNYLRACQPKSTVPIHNALLSEIGESIHYRIIEAAASEARIDWQVLPPGQSIEI